jgi:hypothetical protein
MVSKFVQQYQTRTNFYLVTDAADDAAVSNITMRNVYIYQCTQMLMIKTFPGGTGATGYVKHSLFENFWAYDTTYGLGKTIVTPRSLFQANAPQILTNIGNPTPPQTLGPSQSATLPSPTGPAQSTTAFLAGPS